MMNELGNLFNKYKCDKTRKHKYDLIYEPVLEKLKDTEINILEVGVFNGHSTEAFHEYLPKANLYGLDIFERTNAEDLPCYKKDRTDWIKGSSTDTTIGKKIIEKFGNIKFDIIIDDGLHTPFGNKMTFRNLLPFLKNGGTFFIEDVWPLESMSLKELEHPWLVKHPDRYSLFENDLFLNEINNSGLSIIRHDNRKKTNEPDSYIIELK